MLKTLFIILLMNICLSLVATFTYIATSSINILYKNTISIISTHLVYLSLLIIIFQILNKMIIK